MIALKHILVPTDFSEVSETAVLYGKEFASAFDATLHLIHVFQRPGPRKVNCQVEQDAQNRLAAVLTDEERQDAHARLVVNGGDPVVQIVRYAEAEDIDLIVMGTHGFGPVAHALLGSVAAKVARKAPCPVLIVRHPEHEFVLPEQLPETDETPAEA